MAHDVFISHSARDKKVAETICGALEQSGIQCWVAPRDVRAGKSFPGEITRAIQQTKVMLMIFSQHSNSSEQVLREIQLAVDCRVPIVRLRIEDVPLSDDLRYYLSTPHWLDALSHPLSKHIPPLAAAIRELLGPSSESDRAQTAVEAGPRLRPPASGQPSPAKWKPLLGGAIVLAIGLAVALWMLRPQKPGVVAPAAPTPQQTAPPSPSPAVSPTLPAQPTLTPLAVAPVPSPTAVEMTPTPEGKPPSTAINKKEPSPRNDRPWQVWIDEFVHDFIASNESNDVDLAVSFYAPTVDLFEEGRKSIDAIRREVESYNARWPSRRATIRGDVRLGEKAKYHSYTASYEHDYYVENASRGEWINGAVVVDLQIIIDGDGVPRIVSMKQKTLRRDKGTMQKR